ncbi:hypothetical protein [Streptomyces sp. NRRL S-1448]|uniref:hypothetical protein n=1 Tax=Streptomyces sp. NRRL S-1448 TaxID=1463883 RepID=UPI00068EEBED|nr:hypothetical protein [Streptomyces sp. NRRL S-1448]
MRVANVLDAFSLHPTTKKDTRVGDWAAANNVEVAHTSTYSPWLNPIEAQFTALRCFSLNGTDHASLKQQGNRATGQQGNTIRRHLTWRKAQP